MSPGTSNRIEVLCRSVGRHAGAMADASEAWSPGEVAVRLSAPRRAGRGPIRVEDPRMREDCERLRAAGRAAPDTGRFGRRPRRRGPSAASATAITRGPASPPPRCRGWKRA
jgi:hypothetical protein